MTVCKEAVLGLRLQCILWFPRQECIACDLPCGKTPRGMALACKGMPIPPVSLMELSGTGLNTLAPSPALVHSEVDSDPRALLGPSWPRAWLSFNCWLFSCSRHPFPPSSASTPSSPCQTSVSDYLKMALLEKGCVNSIELTLISQRAWTSFPQYVVNSNGSIISTFSLADF